MKRGTEALRSCLPAFLICLFVNQTDKQAKKPLRNPPDEAEEEPRMARMGTDESILRRNPSVPSVVKHLPNPVCMAFCRGFLKGLPKPPVAFANRAGAFDNRPKPFGNRLKPFGNRPKPFDNRPKPFGNRPKPFGNRPKPFVNRPKPFGNRPKPFGNRLRPFGNRPKPFDNRPKPFGNRLKPFGNPRNPFQSDSRPFVKKTPVFRICPRRTSHGGSRTRISLPWRGASPAQSDRMERLRVSSFAPFVSFVVQSQNPCPRNPGLAFRPLFLLNTPRPQAGIRD